jgi:IMP and pyridine-specific 5'-nucleotidase
VYLQSKGQPEAGRLRQLVPGVGIFFTKLPLERAFYAQDERRSISRRRMVSPSFNDIRLILNTAQVMVLGGGQNQVELVTFDGDVTLYDDGESLIMGNPVIPQILCLLKRDIYVGIVTAAGYADKTGKKYIERLGGLLDAIRDSPDLTERQRSNLLVMGGEANYLFRFNGVEDTLDYIEEDKWTLPEVREWSEADKTKVLDLAEMVLSTLKTKMNLPAQIIRKPHGVGLVPLEGKKMCREELEEVVLNVQNRLMISDAARRIHFCAFNGGSDVWVDIGDKRLGVLSLQRFLGGIKGEKTLHVGDQFASIGANDFKARLAGCTVWVANPAETVEIVEELIHYLDESEIYND